MSETRLLKVRVSLKGRPVRSYRFTKEVITVGRNPDSDIFLDNPGISREHLNIERNPDGSYAVQDLESANGTFVNDVKVSKQYLCDEDVVRIGKFSLWVSYEDERRGAPEPDPRISPLQFDGTTVLKTAELEEMMETSREKEPEAPLSLAAVPRPELTGSKAPKKKLKLGFFAYILTFVLGVACGMWGLFFAFLRMRTG
jgi:pSer/pThr/pTyr-binding forkhead associated (FHA) protein